MRTLTVTLLAAATVLVLAAAPSSAAGAIVNFRSPSGAIHCAYVSGFGGPPIVRCDTDYPTRFRRPPAGCMGDFGQSFAVTSTGRGRAICVTDSVNSPSAAVLRYGTKRTFGAITCTSKTSGLRCYNARGHGFFLARNRQLVY
ncbi:MAG: hypothetical protein QOE65_108 [Solirubrobacteraceae bacterium]|jgi:hypothetical protein|nr:hypothetical protein [Solirubrobacteraceae bacterium]